MLNRILQFIVDPRVLLGFGVAFFGGILAIAEVTQYLEKRRERSHGDEQPEEDSEG